MVPQPVHAVVLLFPISKEMAEKRQEEKETKFVAETRPPFDPEMIYIKQTVYPALPSERIK